MNDSDNVDKHHLGLACEVQLQLAMIGVYSGGILLHGHKGLEGLSTLAVSVLTR
jgi:hypothetical protein